MASLRAPALSCLWSSCAFVNFFIFVYILSILDVAVAPTLAWPSNSSLWALICSYNSVKDYWTEALTFFYFFISSWFLATMFFTSPWTIYLILKSSFLKFNISACNSFTYSVRIPTERVFSDWSSMMLIMVASYLKLYNRFFSNSYRFGWLSSSPSSLFDFNAARYGQTYSMYSWPQSVSIELILWTNPACSSQN